MWLGGWGEGVLTVSFLSFTFRFPCFYIAHSFLFGSFHQPSALLDSVSLLGTSLAQPSQDDMQLPYFSVFFFLLSDFLCVAPGGILLLL